MHTSSNDIRRVHISTHHTSKEQGNSRTNKDGKEYVKHHIPGQKNKHLGKRKEKVADVIEQARRPTWTWAGHVSRIRDNRWTLRITSWKHYERKRPRGRPAKRWRDELDDYWKRIAQVSQTWKQHAEAFAQPRDAMAAH